MLGLTMNGDAWKIVREALRGAGATQKMTGCSWPNEEDQLAEPHAAWSRDEALKQSLSATPLVRQAQELFQAEVRSVLDLRGQRQRLKE